MQRKTKQRTLIMDAIKKEGRPLKCQEILEVCQKDHPKTGIATVYRAVKDFLADGLVSEITLPGDGQRYTAKIGGHFHYFLCRLCDKAFNVEGCTGSLNFSPPKNFKTEAHEVFFRGVCESCDGH